MSARVLVASDRGCPTAALSVADAIAGREGQVVFAAVLVVPLAQPLGATLDRAVADACADLDRAERAAAGAAAFDTRLLRARSFAEGVLAEVAAEPYDALVLEIPSVLTGTGALRGQIDSLLERAEPTVVLVRPERGPV